MLFDTHSRVVFLGDSITANGRFIANIFDYYKENLPERQVKLYNYGVPGDSAAGCLRMERHRLLLDLFKPTEIVLMFGMNDIGRSYYADEVRDTVAAQVSARKCKLRHTDSMLTIARFFAEKGLPVTLCSVTPHDEITPLESPMLVGCHGALRDIYARDLLALAPYIKDTVDFGGPMNDLLSGLRETGGNSFIGPDRVHPTDMGHDVMARIFLCHQGADVAMPTAETITDGTAAMKPYSPENAARKEAEAAYRGLSYIDFNAQWGQEKMTLDEKIAYWQNRLATDFSGELNSHDLYVKGRAAYYVENKRNEESLYLNLLARTDEMYS